MSCCITLKPVFSRLADAVPVGVTLPSDWSSLSWHQMQTFEALSDPNINVIFNTAITGDGIWRLFCHQSPIALTL